MNRYLVLAAMACVVLLAAGWMVPNPVMWNSLEVSVTAYNSTPGQTQGDPFRAAWGDRLEPGMQCVAVSRDLIPMGLDHNAKVYLKGIGGPYLVLDKMNRRFTKKIDVYYGLDIKGAREFGEKKAVVYWR